MSSGCVISQKDLLDLLEEFGITRNLHDYLQRRVFMTLMKNYDCGGVAKFVESHFNSLPQAETTKPYMANVEGIKRTSAGSTIILPKHEIKGISKSDEYIDQEDARILRETSSPDGPDHSDLLNGIRTAAVALRSVPKEEKKIKEDFSGNGLMEALSSRLKMQFDAIHVSDDDSDTEWN